MKLNYSYQLLVTVTTHNSLVGPATLLMDNVKIKIDSVTVRVDRSCDIALVCLYQSKAKASKCWFLQDG